MSLHRHPLIELFVRSYLSELAPKAQYQLANEYKPDYVDEDDGDETYTFSYFIDVFRRAQSGELITREESQNCMKSVAYQHLLDHKIDFDVLCQVALILTSHQLYEGELQ